MINKKAVWLGLATTLAVTPFLVAQLVAPATAPPQAAAPPGAANGLGSPWQEAQILVKPAPAPPPQPAVDRPMGGSGYAEMTAPPPVVLASPAPVVLPPAPPVNVAGPAPVVGATPGLPASPVAPVMPVVNAKVSGQEQPPEKKQPEKQKEEPKQTTAPTPAAPSDLEAPAVTSQAPKFGPPAPASGAAPQATNVSGGQSTATGATNLSDVLTNTSSPTGVEVQKRSPLVGDPRIEGFHFGQVVTYADGGYWFPARVDLDTVISKMDANIGNVSIIKGPFSVRYGPGFSFLDIESLPTPRSGGDWLDVHGSTSLRYQTNGQGWQGLQTVSGGNCDWGFRLSYNLQSADDYYSGNGTKMPSSYNNQFVNFALGFDLSKDASLEMKYTHVQQSNVLIPGLVTDINELVSDAFTARYTAVKGSWYDRLTIDAWINHTSFNGDSSNPQTRLQVPFLDNFLILPAGFNPVRLDINTNGDALSYGAREIITWGDVKGFNISLGADIRVFQSYYNEFDAFNFSTAGNGSGQPANLGIPNGRQIDPGLLADTSIPFGDTIAVKAGTRVDFLTTQFLGFGPNQDFVDPLNPPATDYVEHVGNPQGDRTYFLFSAYLTAENKITNELTLSAGYGYAERAPTLTELYAGGAYLGLIQNGLNSFYGNASLRKEELHQLNLGFHYNDETFRAGGNAFYAYMPNYITYSNLGPLTVVVPNGVSANGTRVGPFRAVSTIPGSSTFKFINTPLANMYGFDAFAEYDVLPWMTPFATMSVVEGWDQTRHEALPGIAPLDSRIGVRFHTPGKDQKWGIEYYARVVAPQDMFAQSLNEQRTGGFVVHNVRAYWQAREYLLLLAGVENIGNLNYREHLDLLTPPTGVYQPGINFYVGMKVSY